jgi:DNA-binding CsgD family transcriptional regulator
MHARLLNGQRAAIYGLLMLGLSTEKIAAILGKSRPTIRCHVAPDWMPRAGGRRVHKPERPRRPRIDHAAVIAMHDGGAKTMQEVAAHFGVTRERVRQILARHGIDVRRGNGLTREQYNERLQRYHAALKPGVSTKEAVAAIGLTYQEVQAAANALGVSLPKPIRKGRIRRAEIAAYYAAHTHMTGNDVARHFGVSPNTVSAALRTMGVQPRHNGWVWRRRPDHHGSPA